MASLSPMTPCTYTETRIVRVYGPALLGWLVCLGSVCYAAGTSPPVQWSFQCKSEIYSSPVAAELDNQHPGLEIVIASSAERTLYCLNSDGKPLWTYDRFSLRLTSTPTVADLDQNGVPEILVTSRSDGLVCLGPNGALRWTVPNAVIGAIPWGNAAVLQDRSGGRPAAAVVSLDGLVTVFCAQHDSFALQWTFKSNQPGTRGPVAAGDVNSDGIDDIVVGGLSSVYCLSHRGKNLWQFEGAAPFNTGPVLADLNRDSTVEVLAASDDGVVYCLDGRTGKPIWSHRTFTGRIDTSIAAGDIDGDGMSEVFYGDAAGHFYCLDCRGGERWSFDAGDWIESAPVIGDVDGDGRMDVLFGCANGYLYCLSSIGGLEWTFSTGKRISASPTLCDCNLDGKMDILVASHNGSLYCLTAGAPWKPDNAPWPSKRHDLNQTGSALSK